MRTKIYNYSIISGLLLALILSFVFMLTVNYSVALAASSSENESNNTAATATDMAVNSSVSGSLSEKSDTDWYKFSVVHNGYFNVSFEHTFLSSTSSYWKIYIYDQTGVNNIDGGTDTYFTSAGNSNSKSNTFGILAGTYYIKVVRYDSYSYSANQYTLTVNYTEASNWETENNNTKETSDILSINTTINGTLSRSGDVDWYTFEIPQNGYFSVFFGHELLSSSSSYWKIFIYDESGVNNIDGGMDTSYAVAGNANKTTNTYGVKAGVYFLKIVRYDSYSHSANPYNVVVNYTPSSDWEIENNNTKETANEITFNQVINGAITRSGDDDWYKLEVNNSREIAITFNHPAMSSTSSYWRIYLFDASGVTELLKWGRRGDTESATSDYINVSAGTYFIKVARYDSYSHSPLNYALSIVEKHDHTGIWKTTLEPTCTEKGISSRTCTICGFVETRDIEAHGHSYDDGKVIKEAGVAQKGEIQYTCTICGDQYTKTDGHLLWVIPVACVGGVIVLIGVINYIRVLRKKKA